MAESSKKLNHCLYQQKWFLFSFYSNESCPLGDYTLKLFNLEQGTRPPGEKNINIIIYKEKYCTW